MNVEKIEKLEEVVQHLGPYQKIKDYKLSRLTAPGENYGSLILSLQLKLVDQKTKSEQDLELVAKLLPPSDLLREIFYVQVTFRNEAGLYSTIVPTLEEFQRQQGASEIVDIFLKYYGSRISLDPDKGVVDDGAVLLLENLKPAGFSTGDRLVGFDLATSRFVIKNLAYFHAIPLALKLINPDIFAKKVKPYLYFQDIKDLSITEKVTNDVINVVKEDPNCAKHLERIRQRMDQNMLDRIHEPFATLTHRDFWVNNMLLKHENGKPVAVKMVDFQIIDYRSPCVDLIFFLFTSVELEILKKHLDELIDIYYESFIDKLRELKCETSPFSRQAFDEQMKLAAIESEYYHLGFMIFPLHAARGDVKELNELTTEDFLDKSGTSDACKAKLVYITLEFIRRGWL